MTSTSSKLRSGPDITCAQLCDNGHKRKVTRVLLDKWPLENTVGVCLDRLPQMVRKYSEIFVSRLGGPLLAKTLTSGLSDPDRHRLTKIMRNRQYEKGDSIFSTGNVPDEIVVLANGTAELISGADARDVAMGE